ncbi:MAG: diguanylate cyclase [Alishewanella aestuarii]
MSLFKRISLSIGLQLALMISWVLLYLSASLLEYSPHASLWYPPAALSFAAMTLFGLRVFPAFFLVCLLMSIRHLQQYHPAEQIPYFTATLPALAHAVSYLFGALLLRLLIKSGRVNYSATLVAYLILASAAALLAAYSGAWSLQLSGLLDNSERLAIWLGWWIGDLVAILSLSPFLVLLLDHFSNKSIAAQAPWLMQHGHGPRRDFFLKLFISLLLLTSSMLIAHQVRAQEITFLILFLSLPAMWLVYTESVWRSFSGLAIISLAIVSLMAILELDAFAALYQFTIAMIAVAMLYGTAVPLLQNTNRQLQRSLQTDPLTGVLSRQGFIEQAAILLGRAGRRNDKICLVVLDLDHFKQVNDVLGHQVGDEVLHQVCQTLQQQLRQPDLIGRFGGDELMLLLPDTKASEAVKLCERLRASIEALQIKVSAQLVTASFGICEQLPDEDFSQLFARADKTLLQAKQRGRNRIEYGQADALATQ